MTAVALATILAGLLAGNELGTLTVAHPALERLPLPTQIAAEQALTGRLSRIMPFVMTATIATTILAGVLLIGEPGFTWAAAAAIALVAMLAITLIGNVPRNRRTEQFPEDGTLDECARSAAPGSACTSPASRSTPPRSPRSSSHSSSKAPDTRLSRLAGSDASTAGVKQPAVADKPA